MLGNAAVEFLIQSWDRGSNKETKRSLKKRLESARKELHLVESWISEQEFLLGVEQSGDATMVSHQQDLDVIVESETVETVEGGDAPWEGVSQESTATPPRRGGRATDGDQPSDQPCVPHRG